MYEEKKKEKACRVKYKRPVNLGESHMMSLNGVSLIQLFCTFDNFQNEKKNWKDKFISYSQLSM